MEHAYAQHFLAHDPARLTFLMSGPFLPMVALPHDLVTALLAALQTQWQGAQGAEAAWQEAQRLAHQARTRHWLGRGRGLLRDALAAREPVLHLLVSHRGADRPGPVMALKRQGARFIPFVHDLIPITHPEYAPPRSTRQHLRRLETFATLADGIIVHSGATAESLAPFLAEAPRHGPIPVLPAPLGVDPVPADGNFPCPET
ncbi:MAG: glycosyltransferase family 1 protein, partial [Alphaproteobacteria bacterium]